MSLTTCQRVAIAVLIGAGVIVRVVLAVKSPQPYGYVWDFYHEGIQVLYEKGRLPLATDCWQCYHPPLFYLAGWPFYDLGEKLESLRGSGGTALRWLSLLPVLAGVVTVWFGWRILRLFSLQGWDLVLGFGLLVSFPLLVIGSYGIEADIVLTAVIVVFTYYLCLWWRSPDDTSVPAAVRLGVLAGLAAATKYNGLAALTVFVIMIMVQSASTNRRRPLLVTGAIVVGVGLLVGGWKYVDNLRRYDTPMYANGPAQKGFQLNPRRYWDLYNLVSVRPGELLALWGSNPPMGELTELKVYRSVPTTLYANAWTDMTFFSEPTRHGHWSHPYPKREMPVELVAAVLALGLLPTGLAVVGFFASLRERAHWPLAVLCVVTIAAYVWWFLPQASWALKTKYMLFLLPAYVVYAIVGLQRVRAIAPRILNTASVVVFVALLASVHAYLLVFAVGHM